MRFWVSWVGHGPNSSFAYNGPWWISGSVVDGRIDTSRPVFCAAVIAETPDDARRVIEAAHANIDDAGIEGRFVDPKPDDWMPFAKDGRGRFPYAKWMQWPEVPDV